MSNSAGFSPTSIPSVETLKRLAISESGFVFDPVSGHHFTLNETGLELLRRLQQDNALEPLMEQLTQEYDVSKRTLERDIMEFTGLLREYIGE